jgi:FKBP-type peptidyl-prolyl cis-trans isomerase (trigger factor)
LKETYKKEIVDTYKLEFLLSELADKENITVTQKEIDTLFQSITDPKEKEAAKANSYFYASILRKQKTLDYLLGM